MATIPTVPSIPAGSVASSDAMNEIAEAASFNLGSASGTNPFWYLTQTTAKTVGTSAAAFPWANPTKDNDGVYSSGSPNLVTIVTPGFYTIDWAICLPNLGALTWCQAYVLLTTTASNQDNPSTTLKFQNASPFLWVASGNLYVHSGGLVPSWLNTGDYLQIIVQSSTSASSLTAPPPYFQGEWVSQ